MRMCRYGTFMCSPVKVSYSARCWCKVCPVNSNECLKVIFSSSRVGFMGGAAAAYKRRSFVVLKVLLKLFHRISSFHACANEFNDPKKKQENTAFSLAHHKNCHENWGFFAHWSDINSLGSKVASSLKILSMAAWSVVADILFLIIIPFKEINVRWNNCSQRSCRDLKATLMMAHYIIHKEPEFPGESVTLVIATLWVNEVWNAR